MRAFGIKHTRIFLELHFQVSSEIAHSTHNGQALYLIFNTQDIQFGGGDDRVPLFHFIFTDFYLLYSLHLISTAFWAHLSQVFFLILVDQGLFVVPCSTNQSGLQEKLFPHCLLELSLHPLTFLESSALIPGPDHLNFLFHLPIQAPKTFGKGIKSCQILVLSSPFRPSSGLHIVSYKMAIVLPSWNAPCQPQLPYLCRWPCHLLSLHLFPPLPSNFLCASAFSFLLYCFRGTFAPSIFNLVTLSTSSLLLFLAFAQLLVFVSSFHFYLLNVFVRPTNTLSPHLWKTTDKQVNKSSSLGFATSSDYYFLGFLSRVNLIW